MPVYKLIGLKKISHIPIFFNKREMESEPKTPIDIPSSKAIQKLSIFIIRMAYLPIKIQYLCSR